MWKDVPPQHWNTPSGQYAWQGVGGKCVQLGDAKLAYERNRLADEVLQGSGVSFVRTWNHDAPLWRAHNGKDCTHYCNPGPVTLTWASETLRVVSQLLMHGG